MRFVIPRRRLLIRPPASVIPPVPPFVPDVIASTSAQVLSALTSAPANLGRHYGIGLSSGSYGALTLPDGYSRGTTQIVARGLNPLDVPVFSSVRARSAQGVTFRGLHINNTQRDPFGYPAGGEAFDVRGAQDMLIQDVSIQTPLIGFNLTNTKRLTLDYFRVVGAGNDAIRAYTTAGDVISDLTIRRGFITVWAPDGTFPGMSLHGSYTVPTAVSVDPRRSDQYGYQGSTTVNDLEGNPVSVSQAVKDGRHADGIQFNGETRNVLIEDVDIVGFDGYTQGIFAISEAAFSNGRLATGFVARRCRITCGHPNGIKLARHDSTALIDSCVIRNWPGAIWANGTPAGTDAGLMRSGITLRDQTQAVVTVRDCVRPANFSSYWWDASRANVINLQSSDTALPPGWETGAIALGTNRPFGWAA